MHGGTFTLTAGCIFALVIAKFLLRMRGEKKREGIFSRFEPFFNKLIQYTDPTAYLASISGVLGLIGSSVVGLYVWPGDLIRFTLSGLTKITFSIIATELWISFIILRSKYGKDLWKNNRLAIFYVCTGFVGFFFIVLTGSWGRRMAGKASVLDPIYELLRINFDNFFIIGSNIVPILFVVTIIEIVTIFIVFLSFGEKRKIQGIDGKRRKFLKIIGIGSGIVAVGGAGLIHYFKLFEGPKKTPSWPRIRIANMADLEVNEPLIFNYPLNRTPNILVKLDGEAEGGVGPNNDVVAFSQLCQHQGCPVSFLSDGTASCHCHLSIVDLKNKAKVLASVKLEFDLITEDIYAVGMGPPVVFGFGELGSDDVDTVLVGGELVSE
jgi:arsenite oxidase small subunit